MELSFQGVTTIFWHFFFMLLEGAGGNMTIFPWKWEGQAWTIFDVWVW
jgi:hypothetical protein